MAITRAQQARQMYKKGSEKPVVQAGVMNFRPSEMVTVPKIAKSSPTTPTAKLAYITPEEQDILIDLNLYGSLKGKPNRGPGGIPSLEGDFGGPGGFGGFEGGADFGGARDSSGTAGDFSGFKDTGTGNYVSNDPNVSIQEQRKRNRIAEEAKEAFEKRQKEIKDREAKEAKDLSDLGKKQVEDAVMKRRKRMGAKYVTDMFDLPADYDEEKDDTAAMLDLFTNNPYREDGTKRTLPTPTGIGLSLLEEPLKAGAKKTREFFSGPTTDIFGRKQKGVLSGGRFFYKGEPLTEERFANMSLTEKNQAYDSYMADRLAGKTDAYGNPIGGYRRENIGGQSVLVGGNDRDDGAGQKILPIDDKKDDTEEVIDPRDYTGIAPRFMGSIFDFSGPQFAADGGIMRAGYMDGGRMRQMEMMQDEDDPEGGIMDLESGRQMYFLGKLVKKAGRAIKKVVKSPIGKAALLYFGGKAFMPGGGPGILSNLKTSLIGKLSGGEENIFKGGKFSGLANFLRDQYTSDGGKLKFGLGLGLGVPFALDALGVGKDEDEGTDLDEYYKTQGIDIDAIRNNPNRILARRFMAEGGDAEPVAKKTMPLLDMGGMEKDYRKDGGFVPIGRMERADDVPARLSKNEFVFTADAVRNAGDGDIDKGAEVMYNMMKNLESGGEVSEESQGLDGAREMFQTSQRLEEVL